MIPVSTVKAHRAFVAASRVASSSEQTRLLKSRHVPRTNRNVMFLTVAASMGILGILAFYSLGRRSKDQHSKFGNHHGNLRRGWVANRQSSVALGERSNEKASISTFEGPPLTTVAPPRRSTIEPMYDGSICVGHAAVGEDRKLAALTVGSKRRYAEERGYEVVTLEADDAKSLRAKYCPELMAELDIADESMGLKYCTIWHAIENKKCSYMAWIDVDALILDESFQIDSLLTPGVDAVWFRHAEEEISDSNCTDDLQGLDTSLFVLGDVTRKGWLRAFIHLKLAFSGMPNSFLQHAGCNCAASKDGCTTSCLYKHHPDWFGNARCLTSAKKDFDTHKLRLHPFLSSPI